MTGAEQTELTTISGLLPIKMQDSKFYRISE